LGFYEDSAAAYDRYLKLKPGDDAARRERGFDWARVNQTKLALQDLEWYVARHPRDAAGYYELAVAHVFDDRPKAIALLDKAVALDPALNQARYTRALLNIEQDNPAAAIPDLELYLKAQPNDARGLAYLGKAYLAVNRAGDAAAVLEKARSIDPQSSLVLVQYRRALVKLGRTQEAAALLAELRDSGNRSDAPAHRVGLVDYLSLPPAEQQSRYASNLREQSAADPSNVRLRFALARALLAEGKEEEGVSLLQNLPVESLDAALLRDCGRTLMDLGRFAEAVPFLERAEGARIDLATAIFHSQNPDAALRELDKTPAAQRKGDYYLLRAQILDAQGNVPAAADALNGAMRAEPARASLYYEASSFLLKHKLYKEVLQLLDQASRVLPDDRELLLAKAVTLDLLRRADDCDALLVKIQARWPEWNRPYLLKGILLQTRLEPAKARRALDTAIALGANTPEAYYYQALSIMDSAPEDLGSAQTAITHALALSSQDPYIYLLAGKIALARKDYNAATAHLLEATRLAPALVPAHYALRDLYTARGDESKASDELKTIKRISSETGGTGDVPVPFEDLLFTVHR
jgi:tetratricopeptide (TPR) repeat protein